MNKFLQLYGPLIFWTLMFFIGAIIEALAFDDLDFWIKIPHDISLWAAGVLFTLSTSEETYYNAKLKPNYKKNEHGSGFAVDYEVTVNDEFGFKPKFMYLFLVGAAIWIVNLILSKEIAELLVSKASEGKLIFTVAVSYILGVAITVIALFSTYEVSK